MKQRQQTDDKVYKQMQKRKKQRQKNFNTKQNNMELPQTYINNYKDDKINKKRLQLEFYRERAPKQFPVEKFDKGTRDREQKQLQRDTK